MRVPSCHNADALRLQPDLPLMKYKGTWVLARPLGYPSWTERWRRAWHVLLGKADALYWGGDQ